MKTNKFLIVATVFWLAMTAYNLFIKFDLIAVIISTTWFTINFLIYAEEQKNKNSIFPRNLSKRQIRKLINSMPKSGVPK